MIQAAQSRPDQQVVGSAETGYSVLSIDPVTGKVSTTSVIPGKTSSALQTSPGFASYELEQDVRSSAASLLPQILAGTLSAEDAYNQLRTAYSPQEVTNDALKSLVGLSETAQSTQTQTTTSKPIEQRATSTGSLLGATLKGVPETLARAELKTVSTVGGFFEGLFSGLFGE